VRIVPVVAFAILIAARLGAAAESGRSASAALVVSATVVSSCSVATAQGQVALRCAHGALGPVRVNGQAPDPRETPPLHMSVTGSLVTIDF
jgi:hypothetical protein